MGGAKGQILNAYYGRMAKQARYSENGIWYHHLEFFPADLYDAEGVVRFETEAGYLKLVRIGPDANHIHADLYGDGISTIPGYMPLNPPPKQIL